MWFPVRMDGHNVVLPPCCRCTTSCNVRRRSLCTGTTDLRASERRQWLGSTCYGDCWLFAWDEAAEGGLLDDDHFGSVDMKASGWRQIQPHDPLSQCRESRSRRLGLSATWHGARTRDTSVVVVFQYDRHSEQSSRIKLQQGQLYPEQMLILASCL